MAYIGKQPTVGNFVKLDAITTSATTTFNLTNGGVAYYPQSPNHCLVSLNGILQAPTDSFTISGSTIIFSSALTTSDVIDFIIVLGDVLNIGTPSDNTVSLAKLTATGTKDATTFLRGDNTFAVPSSDYVKLASGTISSSVSSFTLDGYFTSTYNKYVVYVNNLQLTTDAGIYLRYVKSGSELTSNHNFSMTGGYRNSSAGYGVASNSGWGSGAVEIYAEASVESDANKSLSAIITIDSPLSTNVHHRLHYSIVTSVANGYFIQLHGGSENDLNTTALSGIKIYTTQNFDAGNYQLYGIKA